MTALIMSGTYCLEDKPLSGKGVMDRKCVDCKFDIDVMSAVECTEHKWHEHPDAPWGILIGALDAWDMCCLCGKDAEYVLK
jgi:hypothetical protein